MANILIVDGYNMIGTWPELKQLKETDLESARDLLIDMMAEYQAFTGDHVIVVFDAHLVPGTEQVFQKHQVQVIFTNENETADEKIEQLAGQLNDVFTHVHVATSDYAEQKAIFGQGALRKSARELLNDIQKIKKGIAEKIEQANKKRRPAKIKLSPELKEIFEKWRRGKE